MNRIQIDASGLGALTIRLLLSFVFLYSAIVKVHPIEPFLYTIVESGYTGWFGGAILARVIIGIELALSVLLLFGIAPRRTIISSSAFLALLTLHLLLLMLREGTEGNCGCFGEVHQVSPLLSFFKNLFMLLLLGILWRWKEKWTFPYMPRALFFLTFGIGILLPFIIEPSDEFSAHGTEERSEELPIEAKDIQELVDDGKLDEEVLEGKWVIAFLSTNCHYCKWSARKWGIMEERSEGGFPAHFFFTGSEGDVEAFWEETAGREFPSDTMRTGRLFRYAGNSVPSYYPLEDGEPVERWSLRELREERVLRFLKE